MTRSRFLHWRGLDPWHSISGYGYDVQWRGIVVDFFQFGFRLLSWSVHFHMHQEYPNVVRLQVHLPNQQLIMWGEHVAPDLQQVVAQTAEKDTTLTAYFKANEQFSEAATISTRTFPCTVSGSEATKNGK